MKKLIRIYLLVMFFLTHLVAFAQDEVDRQLAIPLSAPGEPGHLVAELVNGSIIVSSYDGNEVIVQVSGKNREREDRGDHSEDGMRRINANSMGLTVTEEDNTVEINTSSWHKTVNLNIRVPRNFSLNVATVNNGEVRLEGIAGEMEVSNVNGDIVLHEVAGAAVVNTVNGDIEAAFKEINPNRPMAFSTLNGDIDVTLPADIKAVVKMKTQRGDIYSDFDVEVANQEARVERTNEGNRYKVSIEEWVYGKINGGGPEIMMKNMNGDIYIRQGK